MRKLAFILAIAFCTNAQAVEFGPVTTGKQSQDRVTINNAIDGANHCNSDAQCGSADFDCKGQYYNRNELAVTDSVNEYNSNPDYNHKCNTHEAPAARLICRDSKCVPAS